MMPVRLDGALAVALTVVLSAGVGVAIGRATAQPDHERSIVVPLRLIDPTPPPTTLPRATLSVFADGCGVIRTDFPGQEPRGLTWTVKDAAGFDVLQRNALGETRYRYYRPGTYTVVLEAWDGTKYAAISNEVTIHC